MRLLLFGLFSIPAMGAVTISGTLTNGTTEGVGSADVVQLVELSGMMRPVTVLTDITGEFTLEYEGAFEQGRLMVQALKGPAIYSEQVTDPSKPINITVYDNSEEVKLVTRIGSLAFYAAGENMDIAFFFNLDNMGSPPKTLVREDATFSFATIPGNTGMEANTLRSSMPLKQALTIDGDRASMAYPLKPGRTQFMVRSLHTYSSEGENEYIVPVLEDQEFIHILAFPSTIKLEGEGLSYVSDDPKNGAALYQYDRTEGQKEMVVRISGTSATPQQINESTGMSDHDHAHNTEHKIVNTPNFLSEYRWIIVGSLLGFLLLVSVYSLNNRH